MSVEMGLLPPDTIIAQPPTKKQKSAASTVAARRLVAAIRPDGRQHHHQPPYHPPSRSYRKAKDGDDNEEDDDDDDDDDADEQDEDDDEDDEDVDDEGDEREKGRNMEAIHSAKHNDRKMDHAGVEEEEEEVEDEEDEGDEESEEEMEPPTNAESTLLVGNSHLTTVHWDPRCPAGRKVGWRIRVSDAQNQWKDGRIIRYDPCTHKHKIQFFNGGRTTDKLDSDGCNWLHLRMEDGVQIATRLVWAHVKGYAWWPAMVMESDTNPPREGYVSVEFFGSAEVANLRDSPECVRPFEHGKVDNVIVKHKKKRNAQAVQLAVEEEEMIEKTRNEAARFYAERALEFNNQMGNNLVGRRVQVFRTDVNYPYGDTVTGKVRQFSLAQKKWLVSYEMSSKVRKKYEASWINLQSKEHKLRVLDKKSKGGLSDEDIAPFVIGFHFSGEKARDPPEGTDAFMAQIFDERCHGCVDYLKSGESRVTCDFCKGTYHPACVDPPLATEVWQKIVRGGETWCCSKCTPCRGCYQKDIAFGCHSQAIPSTLSFPDGHRLDLCSMCIKAYEKKQFCPNCAHAWDDDHFQQVQRQIRWQQAHRPKKRGRKRKSEILDPTSAPDFISFTAPSTIHVDEPLPLGASVNPTWYHPETAQWGYTEVDMMTCDSCKLWVHAGCAGVDEDEYEQTSNGKHPIYSKEFLCRMCCRKRCQVIIKRLQDEDNMLLFAEPVSEKVAPNYHDVIKNPMDLQTMLVRSEKEEYFNYAWVRELFDLMVLNALTFNRYNSPFWKEAKRFHGACLSKVFQTIGKGAPPSKYHEDIVKNYAKAEEARKMEETRVQQDETAEKKDLVAGAQVATTVTLPKLREAAPDQASCLPYTEVKMRPVDAYFCCWMDCCFTCGSSGASDTMLFCVDCGEAFHSFCVNAPIHSMEASSVAGWRCPNCKVCEISGEASQDELKMLFCEMCDRAFSLDLLDPPLQSAPPGLWICGQCVECKKCDNNSEPRGVSLKYWSRDPQLCYRCGGCDGLVDQYKKSRKCTVCAGVWRDEDDDLAKCIDCEGKVHKRCDPRASLHLKRTEEAGARAEKTFKYRCPTCCKKQGINKDTDKVHRGHLRDHAWKVITSGILKPGDNCSHLELHEKLMDQIDWKTRNLWRDEYRKVVLEGVRLIGMAREQFGDPRYLMERFWHENIDLPTWMGQRATRFLQIAKKLKLDTLGFSARRIENCVLISKLAASWLKVACRTMGLTTKKNVKGYDRVLKLLAVPHESGSVDLPFDSIRCERNRNIINKDEWLEKFEPNLKPKIEESVLAQVSDEKYVKVEKKIQPTSSKIASPLCGWNDHRGNIDQERKWYDSRECCLCHLCGDDDAGLPDDPPEISSDPTKPSMPRVGRLLPLGDGWWVHASCALWSSETWEASSGGLINAMEKARSRGAQLRCFGCGLQGATVGCIKSNCSCNYHFPCAYACGAVFTSKKQMFCAAHKDSTDDIVSNPSSEHMKTLICAPEKAKEITEAAEGHLIARVGALVVHSLGEIEQEHDGFHGEDYITPPGFVATRIYWSTVNPKARTVYVLRVEKLKGDKPVFTITPGDNPSGKIRAPTLNQAYGILMDRVKKAHVEYFSHGDFFSKLPTERRSRKKTFGLNGAQVRMRKVLHALLRRCLLTRFFSSLVLV